MSSDEAEDLRAQLEAMKNQLEASHLREQLRDTQLRAEQLENENLKLRAQQQQQHESQRNNTSSSSSSKARFPIIQEPQIAEEDLDKAFEDMMMECLTAESKRDSLRETYYQKPSVSDKYYFFLEWASYLRKPEVMEQNNKSDDIDILPPDDDEGMRRRHATSSLPSSSDSSRGYDKDLLPKNTPHYNQHQKNRLGPKKLGWPLTIFYYVMLVLAIAGIMWLIKHFLQQGMQVRASNQYDDFEE